MIGLEAADDETLARLKKGYQIQHVERCLSWMTKYGLHPHLTIMVGYYWQTQEQINKTVSFVKGLMLKGLARTLQVTLCTPLDFTEYHEECIREGVLLTRNYDDHDMSKLIVKTPIPHDNYYDAVRKMYSIAFNVNDALSVSYEDVESDKNFETCEPKPPIDPSSIVIIES